LILLDGNVVSEPLRPQGDAAVVAWLDRQAPETLYLATTSLAELHLGVKLLPPGKRRTALDENLHILLSRLFDNRILPFDEDAAVAHSVVVSQARSIGKQIAFGDGQIAAVAHAYNFAVATRHAGPFLAAGLRVIDPWKV
jgi:predicted nucleic acid-binding protein